jgi:hypothetical protein
MNYPEILEVFLIRKTRNFSESIDARINGSS